MLVFIKKIGYPTASEPSVQIPFEKISCISGDIDSLFTGFSYEVNERGLEYYNKLIEELLKYKIEPMVTLYHQDLPQDLQDLGGWANPLSVQWFEDYVKVIFDKFASKVKYWITINQPHIVCAGYSSIPIFPPNVGISGISTYICGKNIILAHAKAYRLYEREYKTSYRGTFLFFFLISFTSVYEALFVLIKVNN